MTVSFLQDPGRSTTQLMKGPNAAAVPEMKTELSLDKVPGTQQATSAFLVTELAVQELTGHLPVPCMADELERQCQRLDSLLEDEDYYAPEDADTFFEPLFERIASMGIGSTRGSAEDECYTNVGSKRSSMVVVQEEHANNSGEHTPATTDATPAPPPKAATKITLFKKHKPANKKTTSPAEASRANYEHYMTTGQPLAAGGWRGCMKSSECDREARHRGICNHKCLVPAPAGVCTDPPSPREGGPAKRPRLAPSARTTARTATPDADDSDGDTLTPGTSHTNAMASWREDNAVDMPAAAEDDVSNHSEADATVSVSLDEPFACFPTIREAWPQHRARLEALGLQHGVDHKSHLRKRFPSLATGFDPNDAGAVGQRQCTACSKQSTPVWRAGPTGPKSLCNACGVRHLKNFKRK